MVAVEVILFTVQRNSSLAKSATSIQAAYASRSYSIHGCFGDGGRESEQGRSRSLSVSEFEPDMGQEVRRIAREGLRGLEHPLELHWMCK